MLKSDAPRRGVDAIYKNWEFEMTKFLQAFRRLAWWQKALYYVVTVPIAIWIGTSAATRMGHLIGGA